MSEKFLTVQRISLDHHVLDSIALHPYQSFGALGSEIGLGYSDVEVIYTGRHLDACDISAASWIVTLNGTPSFGWAVKHVSDRPNGADLGHLEYRYQPHVLVEERDSRICEAGYGVEVAET